MVAVREAARVAITAEGRAQAIKAASIPLLTESDTKDRQHTTRLADGSPLPQRAEIVGLES